jgi:AraC family transcriptional regulator, alkane utilization regulator
MAARPNHLSDRPGANANEASSEGVLADVLRWLRISGSLFLRAEFSAPWGYESPPAEQLAQVLQPGAKRLILFHLVPEGDCMLSLPQGGSVQLTAGDVVILPYADRHRVSSPEGAPVVPIGELVPPPPWDTMPVIRYGGGGPSTQIVCGYLHSDELLFNPVLAALPRLMHLRPAGTPLAAWVEASFRYALHASAGNRPAEDVLLQRLPELLFAECLRLHLRGGGNDTYGWFAALADPVLGRALALLHAEPERAWTLDALARAVASSRSRLDAHFRTRLGVAPMTYLAQWRLQIAAQLLRSSTRGVADIAQSVGYGSEASLSRAFKRCTGVAPAAWRRRTSVASTRLG